MWIPIHVVTCGLISLNLPRLPFREIDSVRKEKGTCGLILWNPQSLCFRLRKNKSETYFSSEESLCDLYVNPPRLSFREIDSVRKEKVESIGWLAVNLSVFLPAHVKNIEICRLRLRS